LTQLPGLTQTVEAKANSQPAVEIISQSEQFSSNGLTLHGYLSLPEVNQSLWLPTLLVCQDFPHGRQDFSFVDTALVDLAARQLGWSAFTFSYRGCGKSEGDFSFAGWQADINAAVDYLWEEHSEEVWIVGFGLGATLGLAAAAQNLRVQGVAAACAYGNLKAWTEKPAKLAAKLTELKAKGWGEASRGEASRGEASRGEASRGEANKGEASRGEANKGEASRGDESRGNKSKGEASRGDESRGNKSKGEASRGDESRRGKSWWREASRQPAGQDEATADSPRTQPALQKLLADVKEIDAVEAAKTLSPRPLLVIHGQDDEIVSPLEARAIADAHAFAELRVLEGGNHNLRYDPRTLALLFSWLDRNPS